MPTEARQPSDVSHLVSMASVSSTQAWDSNGQVQEKIADESGLPRKRKRKTYSCLNCRRRKLKCDRENPCGRCVKEGHSTSCTFHDEGHDSDTEGRSHRQDNRADNARTSKDVYPTPDQRNGYSPLPANESVVLQRKIAVLESKLAKYESNGTAQDRRDSTSPVQHNAKTTFVRGSSFRTMFFGPTNPSSLFAYFPEIFSVSGTSKFKSLPQSKMQRELLALRLRRKERKKVAVTQPVSNLASLLPPYEDMDSKVQLYLDTYDTTLHVIHKPSFWSAYRVNSVQEWKESFVAVVLSMIAVVNCVAAEEFRFREDISSARIETQRLVTAVEAWSDKQSQKHLTIETFQVQLLLMLAKATTALSRKRAWCSSGFLLRLAISSGFHRDPSVLGEAISIFDQEMRRRLWASIVEWDLAVSTGKGLPPMSATIASNCEPPLNINDTDIQQNYNILPEERPMTERTDTSYLRISLQSLSLRSSLASLLNDPNVRLSWSEVLSYEEKILQELQTLPEWARRRQTLDAVMLDLQLRQYILWLYISYSNGESGPKTAYARMATITAASQMIDLYSSLSVADVNALNVLRNDMYQSIVALSLIILSEANEASLTRSLITTLQPTCEKAYSFLEHKVLKVGEGYSLLWFASATFATAQTALDPKLGDARVLARERLTPMYTKILTHQEQTTDYGVESHDDRSMTNGTANASYEITPKTVSIATPTAAAFPDPADDTFAPLDLGEFSNMAGWLNEEFWGWDPAAF